jgi:hypothetical protein
MLRESLGSDKGVQSVPLPILVLTNQQLGESKPYVICHQSPQRVYVHFSSIGDRVSVVAPRNRVPLPSVCLLPKDLLPLTHERSQICICLRLAFVLQMEPK